MNGWVGGKSKPHHCSDSCKYFTYSRGSVHCHWLNIPFALHEHESPGCCSHPFLSAWPTQAVIATKYKEEDSNSICTPDIPSPFAEIN